MHVKQSHNMVPLGNNNMAIAIKDVRSLAFIAISFFLFLRFYRNKCDQTNPQKQSKQESLMTRMINIISVNSRTHFTAYK